MAHAGEFGGIEVTEKIKAEMMPYIQDTAILNFDDPRVRQFAFSGKRIGFGFASDSDYRLISTELSLSDLAAGVDPHTLVVLPRGPLALGPNQCAWFRVAFTANGPQIVEREAEQARHTLIRFITQLQTQHHIAPEHTVVAGFSQGGIMSASVALTSPESVAGFGVLSGRILPEKWAGESGLIQGRDGRMWYVLCLPAICDRRDDPLGRSIGETLWPEWFSHDHWKPFQSNPRSWASLYQQKPAPDEGTYFQRDWFKTRYTQRPAALNIYGTSDYAVTDEGGDWTVHRVWGLSPDGALYMLDGWRGQTSSDKWIEEKLALIKRWKPFAWFGEGGVIQKSIEPALKRRMREAQIFCRLEWVPSIHDKPTRARGFQARASMGLVRLPVGPVGDAILDEYLRFPAGKHDDEVDCGGLIGRALDEAHPAIARPQDGARPVDRWTIARQRDAGTSGGWAA